MPNGKTVPANELIEAILSLPDAKQRLERLKALGIVSGPEQYLSHSKDLIHEERWKLHEHIETWVRRDRIRQLRAP